MVINLDGEMLPLQCSSPLVHCNPACLCFSNYTPTRQKLPKIFPGSDGHIQVVKVKVDEKEIVELITKLCFLECDDIDQK